MIGQIGKLEVRVILQLGTDAVDAQGSVVRTWTTLSTVWAAVKALTGSETTNGNERTASLTHQFTIRRQTSLESLGPGHRIQWGGINYDITTVQRMPEGRPDQYLITATCPT